MFFNGILLGSKLKFSPPSHHNPHTKGFQFKSHGKGSNGKKGKRKRFKLSFHELTGDNFQAMYYLKGRRIHHKLRQKKGGREL